MKMISMPASLTFLLLPISLILATAIPATKTLEETSKRLKETVRHSRNVVNERCVVEGNTRNSVGHDAKILPPTPPE